MKSKLKVRRGKKFLSIIMVVMLVVTLMVSFTSQVSATSSANAAVTNVSNSLMQVRMVYTDDNGTKTAIQGGTGFLINENTILTCAHVVNVDSETDRLLKDLYGNNYNKNNLSLEVVVAGDVTISATLKKDSKDGDYAIVNLNETIGNRVAASLGDSDAVESTQLVYALGFPASVARLQNKNTYTSDDVTITDGKVSKLNSSDGIDYIQHGAILTEGNSGGPLVDENGNVVGINKGQNDNYYYAISINQIKEVLDALQIPYTGGSSAPVVNNDPTSAIEEVTDAPVATEAATLAPPTEASTTPEKTEDGMGTTKLIIIIAIVVLVVLLIVIVMVVILGGKKKSNELVQKPARPTMDMPQAPISNRPSAPQPPMPSQPYARPSAPMQPTMPSNDGAGETSVLNEGVGETTVLGGNQSTGFFLVRKSNNEKININKPEFVIGKERRRVDYCISDNNSISRTHAKVKVRAGRCYITDLGSTNCTFVNGSRLNPNQEVALSKGDKVKFSDEEFEFIG